VNTRILLLAGLMAGLAGAASAQPAPPESGAPAAPPKTDPHVVKLTNSGSSGITAVYVSKAGTTEESDDLLGKQTAGPGKTVVLKVRDPNNDCVFDVQMLMNDGRMVTRKAVNFCQTSDMTAP
jgi:hypothetical protein